ncbi:MAG: hypothetical protein ABIQ26_09265, partial [Streptosporangiaceae bacterium]
LAFYDVFALIIAWGDRYLPGPDGPQLRITHRACGQALDPVLTCSQCGQTLDRGQIRFELSGT